MDQIVDFFTNLLATSDWPPRWYCGKWSDFHGWLYIGSDVAIWLAYFVIPVVIIWFVQSKKNIPFLPVFWLFAAFIIFCGTTHLLDAVMFWSPVYRLSALVRFLTAIISFATVFALIKDLPKLLNFRSKELTDDDSEHYIKDLQNELEEKNLLIEQLRSELNR